MILLRNLLGILEIRGYLEVQFVREGRSRSGARGPLGQCSLCSLKPRDSSTEVGKIQRFLLSTIFDFNNHDYREIPIN